MRYFRQHRELKSSVQLKLSAPLKICEVRRRCKALGGILPED